MILRGRFDLKIMARILSGAHGKANGGPKSGHYTSKAKPLWIYSTVTDFARLRG